MENNKVLVVLNLGRSTEGIKADVLSYLARPTEVVVVRGPHDLETDGSPVEEAIAMMQAHEEVVLVANGGTTAQQARMLLAAAPMLHVEILDVQRDGVDVIRPAKRGIERLFAEAEAMRQRGRVQDKALQSLVESSTNRLAGDALEEAQKLLENAALGTVDVTFWERVFDGLADDPVIYYDALHVVTIQAPRDPCESDEHIVRVYNADEATPVLVAELRERLAPIVVQDDD